MDQNTRSCIIDVQKFLEVVELVGSFQGFHRGVIDFEPVALGDFKHQFRLEGALNMQMQFCFGKSCYKIFNGTLRHGWVVNG